jgi:hypothetical protein
MVSSLPLQQANRALQNIYLLAKLYDLDRIVAFGRALGVVVLRRSIFQNTIDELFVLCKHVLSSVSVFEKFPAMQVTSKRVWPE